MKAEHVKLDLDHYKELFLMQKEFNAMKKELENLRKKNKEEAYDFLLRFIVQLKRISGNHGMYSALEEAATKAGYSIIFDGGKIGKSQLGTGEKIIVITSYQHV